MFAIKLKFMTITQKELVKIFKSRLNTQRRKFNLGRDKVIIISPSFIASNEGLGLSKYIDTENIKIYIDKKGQYVLLEDIESIYIDKDNYFCVKMLNKDCYRIHSKNFFGNLEEILCDTSSSKDIKVLFKQLTLDHNPSFLSIILVYFKNHNSLMERIFDFSNEVIKEYKHRGLKKQNEMYSVELLKFVFNKFPGTVQDEIKDFYKRLYTTTIKDEDGELLKKITNINIEIASAKDNTSSIKIDSLKYLNINFFDCK